MENAGWKTERLRRLLRRAGRDPRRAELGLYAANGSYYLFLSLGPLTALTLSILPLTPLTEQGLLDGLLAQVPGPLRQLMYAVARDVYAASGAALGVSAALELWSGARFLASVVRGVAALGGVPAGGYLRRRAMGAVYTAALVLLILGDLTLQLLGERLLLSSGAGWGPAPRLRALIVLCGLTAGNALLYSRTGRGGPRTQLAPAALAAGAWRLFSGLYSWALERFRLFGVYGSIAAVTASLGWMYGSLYILFAGAWLGQLLREERDAGG